MPCYILAHAYELQFCICFFLMRRRPPRSTSTDTLLPDTTLFRTPAASDTSTSQCPSERDTFRQLSQARNLPCIERPNNSADCGARQWARSEEHTSELQSLMRIS